MCASMAVACTQLSPATPHRTAGGRGASAGAGRARWSRTRSVSVEDEVVTRPGCNKVAMPRPDPRSCRPHDGAEVGSPAAEVVVAVDYGQRLRACEERKRCTLPAIAPASRARARPPGKSKRLIMSRSTAPIDGSRILRSSCGASRLPVHSTCRSGNAAPATVWTGVTCPGAGKSTAPPAPAPRGTRSASSATTRTRTAHLPGGR